LNQKVGPRSVEASRKSSQGKDGEIPDFGLEPELVSHERASVSLSHAYYFNESRYWFARFR